MELWDILGGLLFSKLSFLRHALSNYQYAFTKIVIHLVNITLQCKMAWIVKLSFYQFLLYSNFQYWPCLFFGIFWRYIRTRLLHWLSATKKSLVGRKKFFFKPFLWPTQSFFCHTHSLQWKIQWNGNKCQKRRQNGQ